MKILKALNKIQDTIREQNNDPYGFLSFEMFADGSGTVYFCPHEYPGRGMTKINTATMVLEEFDNINEFMQFLNKDFTKK